MTQIQRTVINASTAPQPIGAYSQAVRVNAGELLFIAGEVALDASGEVVGRGDVAAQTRQVFYNIGQVLDRSGATFSNVAEFTTYLVGRDSIQPFLSARTELFPTLFPGGD
jgi:2-iminobutanoate/2-iminopropanoate deaminase